MSELSGGTTIGGYLALHSGLKNAYLGGDLKINGNTTINGLANGTSLTLSKDTRYPLVLDSTGVNRADGIGIEFKSYSSQFGYLVGDHRDDTSVNANYAFRVGSDQTNTSFVLESPGTGGIFVGTNEVWHAGNFDPSTKSDSHSHPYVNTAGDTMTGNLTMGSNSIYGSSVGRYLNMNGDITLSSVANIIIHADSDDSSTTEYVSVKAGTDDLRVTSGGAMTFNGNKIWHAGNDGASSGLDADTLDGNHASAFLGATSKAADSDKLDGLNSSAFLRTDVNTTITKQIAATDTARNAGMYGHYDSTKIGHIWSMGTAYFVDANGATFGNLYGLAYKHTNNTTGGTMAGSHQMVWCHNGSPKSAMGSSLWTSGHVIARSGIMEMKTVETYDHAFLKMGNVALKGLNSTTVRMDVRTSDDAGYADMAAKSVNVNGDLYVAGVHTSNSTQTRDKIRVWNSSTYTIGMDYQYTYGYLNDYAMTFQMNNDADRGFWWGHSSHTKSQGAMSLTTDGRLYVNDVVNGYGLHTRSSVSMETSSYNRNVMRGIDAGSSYGMGLAIDSGGTTIVGAGEAGDAIANGLAGGFSGEYLRLGADTHIVIHPTTQSNWMGSGSGENIIISDEGKNSSGTENEPTIRPSKYAYGSIGTESFYWYKVFGSYLYGSGGLSSSRALKQNIRPAKNELFRDSNGVKKAALDIVKNLETYRYERKPSKTKPLDPGQKQLGLILDEVPEDIILDDGSGEYIDTYSYITLVLQAVKELEERVEFLEKRRR